MTLLLIALGFAQTLLSPAPLEAADKKRFQDLVSRKLADPYSAHFKWPYRYDPKIYCGWVNAKNRFGAYAGYMQFVVELMPNDAPPRVLVAIPDSLSSSEEGDKLLFMADQMDIMADCAEYPTDQPSD